MDMKYNECLSMIGEFKLLIIIDNWDNFISIQKSNFREFINNLTQKVQKASIFVTCLKSPFREASVQFLIFPLKGLKNSAALSLIEYKLGKFKKWDFAYNFSVFKSRNDLHKEFKAMIKHQQVQVS